MGVIYKLREEVVHYIISQRQSNPLASCRQLAESASEKFGLHLSKSSVHDVLKESGINTPRGRKPKNKFEIPLEKKKQIQVGFSQVKLILPPAQEPAKAIEGTVHSPSDNHPVNLADPPVIDTASSQPEPAVQKTPEISSEYIGAGKIFLKAALWDLGIYSEDTIKESDWKYYLTYTKGIKVFLEGDKDLFIELPLPLERCIREVADGLVTNAKPFAIDRISDDELFKACMGSHDGPKMKKISIVDYNDHEIVEFNSIVECVRLLLNKKRTFVDNKHKTPIDRARTIFFPQILDNNEFMDKVISLKGYDAATAEEYAVALISPEGDEFRTFLEQAAQKLNGMCLRDEMGRWVSLKIQSP